jgi:IS5 family transposase
MKRVLPWKSLIDLVKPHYPKTSSKCVCPSCSHGHHAAHPPAPAVVRPPRSSDGRCPHRGADHAPFAGTDRISDRIPDETTIHPFRNLLEKNDLGKQIFQVLKAHLKASGMAMKQGAVIDAALIAALSSAKNKKGERDPGMHQTKKRNQCYRPCAEGFAYGTKVHIGVNKDNDLIRSVETTAANVLVLVRSAFSRGEFQVFHFLFVMLLW